MLFVLIVTYGYDTCKHKTSVHVAFIYTVFSLFVFHNNFLCFSLLKSMSIYLSFMVYIASCHALINEETLKDNKIEGQKNLF